VIDSGLGGVHGYTHLESKGGVRMESWETGWEVGFPASNADELLLALAAGPDLPTASFS
jgi:hypothetical protein